MAPQNKKLEKFQKQKNSKKPKKTIKPKKQKIYILDSSGSWGASPRPPQNCFFGFIVFLVFSRFFLVFGVLQVFAVVLHVCLLFKAVL